MSSQSVRVTVVTANIGRKHASPQNVDENMGRIRARAPGAVVGFQEVDEDDVADEHRILTKRFLPGPSDGDYSFAGLDKMVPIAVPSPWRIASQSVSPTCAGRKHVTPPRVVVTARVRHTVKASFPPVIFMNGHFPHDAPDLWEDCQTAWRARVAEVHAAGFTIITTRDVNFHPSAAHPRLPALHETERQLVDAGLDRITVIPAPAGSPHRVTVQAGAARVIQMDIDPHNAHAIDLELTAPTA